MTKRPKRRAVKTLLEWPISGPTPGGLAYQPGCPCDECEEYRRDSMTTEDRVALEDRGQGYHWYHNDDLFTEETENALDFILLKSCSAHYAQSFLRQALKSLFGREYESPAEFRIEDARCMWRWE